MVWELVESDGWVHGMVVLFSRGLFGPEGGCPDMDGVSGDELLLVDALAIDECAICRAAVFNENFAGWAVNADVAAGKLVIGGDGKVCRNLVASDGDVTI